MNIFKEHIDLILGANLSFYHPKDFEDQFNFPKKEKKILLTVDDAFQSFYDHAWPYLKKNKFHLYYLSQLNLSATMDT